MPGLLRSFDSLHKLHKAIGTAIPLAVVLDIEHAHKDATWVHVLYGIKEPKRLQARFLASLKMDSFESRLLATQMRMTHFFVKPVDGFKMVDTIHKTRNIERHSTHSLESFWLTMMLKRLNLSHCI